MSETEYNRHIDEFLAGFYGKGWRKIREFIEVYQDEAIDYHIDSFNATMMNDKGEFVRNPDGKLYQGLIFPKKDERRILSTLDGLLTDAQKESGGENAKYYERIEIIRTGLLWYDLFRIWTMCSKTARKRKSAKLSRGTSFFALKCAATG